MKKLLNSYLLVATVLIGFSVISLYSCESNEEKAKRQVKETLDNTKKEVQRRTREADSLLLIITDDNQIMYYRVKALNELKEKNEFFRKYTDNELLHLGEEKNK